MRFKHFLGAMLIAALPACAQMTPAQRTMDFQSLVALYDKQYAPYEWKKAVSGFDLLDLKPWLDRVAAAKDDIAYFEIGMEYVASLNDGHTAWRVPSNFVAQTGLAVDLYDGKPLIETINRAVLPEARFPFQVGDEIVTVDGAPAEEFLAAAAKREALGNPATTRRYAADRIVYRPQSVWPSAPRLGNTLTLGVRLQSGEVRSFEVQWLKSGLPLTEMGPVPDPRRAAGRASFSGDSSEWPEPEDLDPALRPLWKFRNYTVARDHPLLQGETVDDETGETRPRRYVMGWGARNPVFAIPPAWTVRLGRASTDFHFSAAYESAGKRIGYLRIPSFQPSNTTTATRELANEIAWFQANTDGLVVDVTRNPGGGCYLETVAQYLIPREFRSFGEQVRPSQAQIISYYNAINQAVAQRADQWIIDLYRAEYNQLVAAYRENRGMTGPIAACRLNFETQPATDASGRMAAYTKPLIILIDEFSFSAGDIFPAVMQDAGRGVLVGARTAGAGGARTNSIPVSQFSESGSTVTVTQVVRARDYSVAGYPTSPYVENVGVHPEIPLEYMTKENLLTRGGPYVREFSRIIVEQILKGN
jgi:hypothetical protein